ncbi:hypothetical protein [Nocardioides lijunqiniae]|uniref:hypothetical protein n=1 Tax=Nocardioides lijunqiniae TaxID=2760832 RepID=UPI0018787327|nr:hypothetical protein [Nocardioides lijunqiniae]
MPVLASVRRLLLAALVVGCFVTVGAAPAQAACSCAEAATPLMSRIKAADAVFVGTVTAVERPSPAPSAGVGAAARVFTQQVEAETVYKGRVDEPAQVVTTTPQVRPTCGLGRLVSGERYVFLVQAASGTTAESWADDGCAGTRLATDAYVAQVEEVLGSGDPVTPPPPPPAAVLTDVDTAEPAAFGRAVAPGLALALVGLLGLVLVSWLRARRGQDL